jgi:hypothetical protein
MKLQFRSKEGIYMFSLLDECAYQQLNNLKNDNSFKQCTKSLNGEIYNCLEVINNVTLTFMKYLEVTLSKGDYIKIINF